MGVVNVLLRLLSGSNALVDNTNLQYVHYTYLCFSSVLFSFYIFFDNSRTIPWNQNMVDIQQN